MNSNTEIAKALIDKGADVNAEDKKRQTVLMIATAKGNIEIAKILIDKGADVNAKDINGATALMWAALVKN